MPSPLPIIETRSPGSHCHPGWSAVAFYLTFNFLSTMEEVTLIRSILQITRSRPELAYPAKLGAQDHAPEASVSPFVQ